ncbi:MAG: chorismate-binding protein, partial [Gaiellaceae bacterium]
MHEVWSAEDPLAEVESYLREAGFFGGRSRDVVADVFLAYGISRSLRRAQWPDPPELCRLPLAAVRVRPAADPTSSAGDYAVGEWSSTWNRDDYAAAIASVRNAIARGDVYQVNLVQHLAAPFEGDAAGLAERLAPLRPLQPKPLAGDGWTIVSASPELFLARRGHRVWTMPIKGTRPAAGAGELRESEKDAAEHVMIVDLERNDLSRVCEPGSV